MGKKNNYPVLKNDTSGWSRDEIICEAAYSLTVAHQDSPKTATRDFILDLWRGNELEESVLPEKLVRRYKVRGALADDTLDRVAAVLKAAARDRKLLEPISLRIIMDMLRYILLTSAGEKGTARDSGNQKAPDLSGKINWSKVRNEWGMLMVYLKMYMTKEEYLALQNGTGIVPDEKFLKFIDEIFGDEKMKWLISHDSKEDKVRISKYHSDSDYYAFCLERMYDRLNYISADFLFASGSAIFGAFRNYTISCLGDDVAAMRAGFGPLFEGDLGQYVKVKDKETRSRIEESGYFDFCTAKAAVSIIYEYSRCQMDIMAICRAAALNRNEITSIVKEAFLCMDISNDKPCRFTSKKEKEAVCASILRLWAERSYEKQLDIIRRKAKPTASDKASKYRRAADELRKENEKLLRDRNAQEANVKTTVRLKDGEIKDLKAEIARLKVELSEKDRAIIESTEEKEELRMLFRMAEEADSKPDPDEAADYTEEEFRAFILKYRVLVWGLRENVEQRYMSLFPEISFASSDRRLTKKQLEAYDVLLMATGYTGHGNFWAARDTAKSMKMPMAYLEKTANSPESLYRALRRAIGE